MKWGIKITKFVLILLTLSSLLATSQKANANESNITIEGIVRLATLPRGRMLGSGAIMYYTNYVDSEQYGIRRFTFKVKLGDDGQWSQEISPIVSTNYPLYKKIQKFYQVYDKTNIYTVAYSEGVVSRHNVIGTTNLSDLEQIAGITPGPYPPNQFNFKDSINVQFVPNILWLALCSSDYFKNKTNSIMPLPWKYTKENLKAFGFRYNYEPLSEIFPIPKSIIFIRDYKLDLTEEQEINRPEVSKTTSRATYTALLQSLKDRRTYYPDGFIVGKYATQQTTNINGISIPIQSEIECFDTEFGGVDLSHASYTVIVTNILSSQDGVKLPPIFATLTVNDYRFHKNVKLGQVDKITYTLDSAAVWPDQNNPKLEKLFENADTYKFNPTFDRVKYVLIALLFVLVNILFLTYLFFFKKPKTNQN
jgi:hypothetical protein